MVLKVVTGLDPYKYTSGRWLLNDLQQRKSRQISFDFDKLCEKVVSCSRGANSISRCVKIEGGFNRAFVILLDNGESLVAKIPFSLAGPPRLLTSSEVATVEYIRKHTAIPVPKIVDWSDDPGNPVGTEYIIQEQAQGVQLHGRWDSMSTYDQLQALKGLARLTQQMLKLELPAYGSLYFSTAPLDPSEMTPLGESGFCIGPHCGTTYWPCLPGDERHYHLRPPNRGPWMTHREHYKGLIDAGHSRIPETTPPNHPDHKGTVDEHMHLNTTIQGVLDKLASTESLGKVVRPVLIHGDLHKRNIFVSDENPGQITGIIDWQGTSIEPAYHYADETPDLCEFPDSWNESDLPLNPSKEEQRIIKGVSICRQGWATMLRGWLPEIYAAQTMDQDYLRLFRYAPSAWQHGATALREDLMEVSKNWTQRLGLKGPCPYRPSGSEFARHQEMWENFKLLHGIKREIVRALLTNSEGWVPIDHWEDTNAAHVVLFQGWLKEVAATSELTEDEARNVWPFDLPPSILNDLNKRVHEVTRDCS